MELSDELKMFVGELVMNNLQLKEANQFLHEQLRNRVKEEKETPVIENSRPVLNLVFGDPSHAEHISRALNRFFTKLNNRQVIDNQFSYEIFEQLFMYSLAETEV